MTNTDFLQQLDAQINALLQDREAHKATIRQFQTDMEALKRQLSKAYVELAELQKKYDNLLIAQSMIQAENGEIKRAKAKLTRMLETIDRCIGQLNV